LDLIDSNYGKEKIMLLQNAIWKTLTWFWRIRAAHALVASFLVVASLVLFEFTLIRVFGLFPVATFPICEVTDLVVLENENLAAFLVRDSGEIGGQNRQRIGLLDLQSGRVQIELETPGSRPACLTGNAGKESAFIGCEDGRVYRYDRNANPRLSEFAQTDELFMDQILHSRSTNRVILRGMNICALDATTGETSWIIESNPKEFLGHSNLCLSKDGKSLFFGKGSGELVRVNVQTGKRKTVLKREFGIALLAVSSDSKFAATRLLNGNVAMMRLDDGSELWETPISVTMPPVFSEDDSHLIVDVSTPKSLHVLSSETGDLVHTIQHDGAKGVCCMGAGQAYSFGKDGCVAAWNIRSGQQRWRSLVLRESWSKIVVQ